MEDAAPTHVERDEVRRALATMRTTTGLPVAFGGVVQTGGVKLSELLGTSTNSLAGLMVVRGNGLGGKALALAKPLAVTDYSHAAGISHQYDQPVTAEGLRSIVAVPVVVNRVVRAVLYGALRQALPLGDRVLTAAREAARDLEQGLAVRDAQRSRIEDVKAPRGWEEVRAAHAELRQLAAEVTDDALRQRVHDVCARLAASWAPPDAPVPALSARELDVLAGIALGQTNAEVARRLGVRPETVKAYLRSAMRKLDVHSRLAAVVAARRFGLLP
ncbi:helix-turn-helix transcriptional regulator [Kutzneria kofuensis]|uniref:DNA-binding CsgD family transcriptional regulator n=1 Tax=Kutzneria kofuensis TaxID=103725 RepID=A0A7W9KEJ6_9PSEU|nr:LuxR C-terminal-related transcriptional regulator [Kutzneria kofuensis]MBB5890997.1 DNA-binding CsgD family transcriptional regulator [Kutzneria kofuensis]